MSSDDAKIKKTAPKKDEVASKDKGSSDVVSSKSEDSKVSDDRPSNYSRGEGQKPVSKAYKDNWNAIFAKKKKR